MNTQLKNLNLDEVLSNAEFVFAKSMPKMPHYYTLRETWDIDTFDWAVKEIRNRGEAKRFFRKFYTYYYANGFMYWTMGNPVNQTKLINRALSDKTDQF